ncbi:hypothetical protein PsorP6_009493 [Peronosclerospora sorghi]|uniref:Uncharacterized protein n=1 Tax=Peronosclerospora sorghi TaxID=230839 RepID=A0ACC0W013_9STRA|nr:hypothetical protein PsorP6_009493 [Peronosclerospora sorghi]
MTNFDKNRPDSKDSKLKRVRLSPPMLPPLSTASKPSSLPPLPPLNNAPTPTSPPSPATTSTNVQKLTELRHQYLSDVLMVIDELKAVLTYGPSSASPDSPVPPSVALKLVRTVQTLEKLRALLLMNPSKLRRVSFAHLATIEQQIKMNLLPIATLFRSFDHATQAADSHASVSDNGRKLDSSWRQDRSDAKSPCSPSGIPDAPGRQCDWRFLSMALSLQL